MPADAKRLARARDEFHFLLSERAKESEWQSFLSENPYVLSSSLPLRLEPSDIIPMARPGKAEPDFVFYPRRENPVPFYGVIELKRPDSKIVTVTRSNTAILSRDAATAVEQAKMYARQFTRLIGVDLDKPSVFLGNRSHLFVIMGLSMDLAETVARELYHDSIHGQLPANLQILPYDEIFRRFDSYVNGQIFFLFPAQPVKIGAAPGIAACPKCGLQGFCSLRETGAPTYFEDTFQFSCPNCDYEDTKIFRGGSVGWEEWFNTCPFCGFSGDLKHP